MTRLTQVHRIVFVGDSLTDGAAWTHWVAATLRAHGQPDLVTHDAGVAGDRVAMVKARLVTDVLALRPDLVLLTIGTNDELTAAEYRRELETIVRAIRQSGARLFLDTPPLVRDPVWDARLQQYGAVVRDLASRYDCGSVDFHAAFVAAEKTGQAVLGPEGVHHTLDGWRTMGRSVLDALGCRAPLLETIALYPGTITDWLISPPIPWTVGNPYPPLPEQWDGWRKFDRVAALAQTSWWQRCWLECGGVMPLGQAIVPGKPGAPSSDAGAFAFARVRSDRETTTTLRVGGSPGYAIWWNGEPIWQGRRNHGYHPDADRFPVTLRPGENRLLAFSNWLFHAALGGN